MIKSVLFSVCFVKVKGSSASRQAGLFTDYSSLSWKSSLTSRSNSMTDSFRLSWSSFWKLSNVSSSLYATMNWSSLYSSISSETGGTAQILSNLLYRSQRRIGLPFLNVLHVCLADSCFFCKFFYRRSVQFSKRFHFSIEYFVHIHWPFLLYFTV